MNLVFGLLVLVAVAIANDDEMTIEDKRIENAIYAMVGEKPPHDVPELDTPNLHDMLVKEMKRKQAEKAKLAEKEEKPHDHSHNHKQDGQAGPEVHAPNNGAHSHHHHDHSAHAGAPKAEAKPDAHEDHSSHHHDHNAHAEAQNAQEGHGAHDHGGHMMMMFFHGGCNEVILFDFWRINSCAGLILSCIVIFAMGALYEGLKWFRVYLTLAKCEKTDTPPVVTKECGGTKRAQSDGITAADEPLVKATSRSVTPEAKHPGPFSLMRLCQASLYIVQLVLAYWLMLIVMTYNSWLTIAVILGAGFGHWLFAALRLANPNGEAADSLATDACH